MAEQNPDNVAGATGVMFGPLTFPSSSKKPSDSSQLDWHTDEDLLCLLCDAKFVIPRDSRDLFQHLFKEHRLVIGDSDRVASLKSYLRYWRARLSDTCPPAVDRFCFTLTMDVAPDGTPSLGETYYLLADRLPEDKQLREGLQLKRLEHVLAVQMRERTDTNYTRGCLFCRHEVRNGCRADYLDHLAEQHNMQLGRPDNLVFIDELIDIIERKIDCLECLYCEKLFKDRGVLKEHMRKKQHKRINPENAQYDRFYSVNYLEMGKNWQHIQNEQDDPDPGPASEEAAEWSDWDSDEVEAPIVCLFCPHSEQQFEAVLSHMLAEHAFDYSQHCADAGLDFYQQVKLVNWIRRRVHCRSCLTCDLTFPDATLLLAHMTEACHLAPPPSYTWNQPEYFFPTYENDSFLCHLEDNMDSDPLPEMGNITLDPEPNAEVLK